MKNRWMFGTVSLYILSNVTGYFSSICTMDFGKDFKYVYLEDKEN
jgi:hypothetical protein